MSTIRKKLGLTLLVMILALVAALPVSASNEQALEPGALTPPPPPEDFVTRYIPIDNGSGISLNGAFNPNHIYLSYGYVDAVVYEDGYVSYGGTTVATQNVQEIGVQVVLQRWTGDFWMDVDNLGTKRGYNIDIKSDSGGYTTKKGYYHRVRAYHYVDHLGVYESGHTIGSSFLVPLID